LAPSSPTVAASPLCSLFVTCWVQKKKTGFKKHLHGWIMWGEGGWSDPTAKVYAEEVCAVREHEAWDLTSSATR
jgi:hypothetical protein